MAKQKVDLKTIAGPSALVRAGSFGMGVTGVLASYTLAIAAGANVVVTSDAAGVAGNALDFQATEDGRTINMVTETGDATFDTIVRFNDDNWDLRLVSGSGLGEGINVYEDAANKILTLMYEDGVSDFDDFETAITASTAGSVHTGTTSGATTLQAASGHLVYASDCGVATWVEESGTPSKTHLHFTDAVTTGTAAKNAINAAYAVGTKTMTATGGDANTMANADQVAKQDLANGVDAVAIGDIKGWDYTPTKTGTGEYTLTFEQLAQEDYSIEACMQLAASDDVVAQPSTYDPTAKTVIIRTVDIGGAAAKDIAVAAGNRINWTMKVRYK